MKKQSKPAYTRLYELVVTFANREQQLFYHVEEKDRQRLLNALTDDHTQHGFYELGGHEGLECLVNTAPIHQLNVLDYVGGIELEAEPELTGKQEQKKFEEREASDEPVIVRLWMRGEDEPIVHHEIEHAAWCLARTCLIETEKFIRFRDEDDEDVLYGTDHIDAIEMMDPFYLKEEQIEILLSRYDNKESGAPEAAGTSDITFPTNPPQMPS